MTEINELISYLISPQMNDFLIPIRNLFLGISFILLILTLILFLKTSWKQYAFVEDTVHFLTSKPYGIKKFAKTWQKVVKRLKSNQESEYKLAVIEADELLNDVLNRLGYKEKKFEDRLGKVSLSLISPSDKDSIIEAHKIRESIVHNPNYRVDLDEAEKVLEIYRKTLSDLGML